MNNINLVVQNGQKVGQLKQQMKSGSMTGDQKHGLLSKIEETKYSSPGHHNRDDS